METPVLSLSTNVLLTAHARTDSNLAEALDVFRRERTAQAHEALTRATRRLLQRLVERFDDAAFDEPQARISLAQQVEDTASVLAEMSQGKGGHDLSVAGSLRRHAREWAQLFEFVAVAGDRKLAYRAIDALRCDGIESMGTLAWLALMRALLKESRSLVRDEMRNMESTPQTLRALFDELQRIETHSSFCRSKLEAMAVAGQ